MSDEKTLSGGCHCGKVRWELTGQVDKAMACNCSICSKTGTVLTFVPEGSFTLKSGEGDLTDYQFNKKNIHHLFCSSCGVRSFGRGTGPDGKKMVAVNVRCVDDVDVKSLDVSWFDGKSM